MKKLLEEDRNKLIGYAGITGSALGFAMLGLLLLCRPTGIIDDAATFRFLCNSVFWVSCCSGIVGGFCTLSWNETLQNRLETENISLSALLDVLMEQKQNWCRSSKTGAAAMRALGRKLIGSHDSDHLSLSSERRKFLYKYLDFRDDRLVHSILAIVMDAEDKQATPWLNQLSEGRWSAAHNPSVQRHAQECLSLLQKRTIQEQNAETLLRASAASVAPAELLRPAENAYSDPEAESQLLRPTLGHARD